MQRLGQHFLNNKSAADKIIHALDLATQDSVIEIGPGHGELTFRIAESNASVIAIEKDAKLAGNLQLRIQDLKIKNVRILHDDSLNILPTLAAELSDYKLVGNIPYYITGNLLRIISESDNKPRRCVFTIQKEVAGRIAAKPPDMNRLAASVQYWAASKILATLPPKDFNPPPKVASAIIALERKPPSALPDAHRYYAAVRTIFAQPRKTLLNNLAEKHKIRDAGDNPRDKEEITRLLQIIGANPAWRPQDLGIEKIIAIAELLF